MTEEPLELSKELSEEIIEFLKDNPEMAQDFINVTNLKFKVVN